MIRVTTFFRKIDASYILMNDHTKNTLLSSKTIFILMNMMLLFMVYFAAAAVYIDEYDVVACAIQS
jgi:hypothetical protein